MSSPSLFKQASAYLNLCYSELNKLDLLESRLEEVEKQINSHGKYELLDFELSYGAKVAWRNSNKCIGRLFWRTMEVLDCRHLNTEEGVFKALLNHIVFATNGGNIKSTITVFNAHKNIRIWNPQLLNYAGYIQENGTIIGDPKNTLFTQKCINLGWKPGEGSFDLLPLVIKIGDRPVQYKCIPENIVKTVSIKHPQYKGFDRLKLKWYATPIISNMTLEIGGNHFMAAPFNGWYMGTEIGARNLSDEDRYNLLPDIADVIGLDRRDKNSLWKDRALIELNQAVLHSFRGAGVKIIDHHSASKQFIQFMRQEAKEGRDVTADWSWIAPPISASTTQVFHTHMDATEKSPNYLYQDDPWI